MSQPQTTNHKPQTWRNFYAPQLSVLVVILLVLVVQLWLGNRSDAAPSRNKFSGFPLTIGEWRGQRSSLSEEVLESLKLEDYLYANFRQVGHDLPINFYIAYYGNQLLGAAAHSPRSCIPGGGWEITSLQLVPIRLSNTARLRVNRAVIAKGRYKQLVYYWFEQRGRTLASEYSVKWYLLVDSITRNRTDGAMIRLVTPIRDGKTAEADQRLIAFLRAVYARLPGYVPR